MRQKPELMTESGKIQLNSPYVVNEIVQYFVAGFMEEVGVSANLMGWIDLEALRINNLFLGIVPNDDFAQDAWNDQFKCGMFVSNALVIDCNLRHAVRDALVVLAAKILRVYKKSGGKFDDAQGTEIKELMNAVRDALLGVNDGQRYIKWRES